jgi:hypothetical protein
MQINAVALEGPSTARKSPPTNDCSQTWRLPVLTKCLEATRDFFQAFMSQPISEYRNMTFLEWTRLCMALKILFKLCYSILDVPEWDDSRVRKETQLGLIIESLCFRMQELTSTGKVRRRARDLRTDETRDVEASLPPDHFFMWQTGLKLLKEVYDEGVNAAGEKAKAEYELRRSKSKCPVLNGSIMNTNYGEALENSSIAEFDFSDLFDSNFGEATLNNFAEWNFGNNGMVEHEDGNWLS